MKVVAVTVTYGKRFQYLSQVIHALMDDPYITKLIIVNNGSQEGDKIENAATIYSDKIKVITLSKNTGSAYGFKKGIEAASIEEATHVLLLDDDNVPEKEAIAIFKDHLLHLPYPDKSILCGNRSNLTEGNTYILQQFQKKPKYTFFDVLNWKKIHFFLMKKFLYSSLVVPKRKEIYETDSFAYGGTLIPHEAIRSSPLPNESLVLYGDDIEYSWNMKQAGYHIYACINPHIYDVDLTFGQDTHIVGLFDRNTKPFKVFFRIRNMVYVSRVYSTQSKPILYLNMIIWFLALFIVALLKKGFSRHYIKTCILIIQAVYAGFFPKKPIPEGVSLP